MEPKPILERVISGSEAEVEVEAEAVAEVEGVAGVAESVVEGLLRISSNDFKYAGISSPLIL